MSQKIGAILSKHESYFNNKKPIHTFKYVDQPLLYSNLTELTILTDKRKIIEFEKTLFTNTHFSIKLTKPNFNQIDNLVGCDYTIQFYEWIKDSQFLQKVAIKEVDMDALIDDLNRNGIPVDQLLGELQKHGKNLAPILDFLNKQHIEISKLMVIMFRNNVTIPNILKNPYIYDLLKQSPTYSWVLGKNERPKETTIDKKLSKRIHVYALFKLIDDEPIIVSVNYNKLK